MNKIKGIPKTVRPVEIAKALGLKSASSIYRWKRVPIQRVLTIEEKLGIPREELRPDLYRRAPTTQRSAP